MRIRWYQHSSHGINFLISLKYRLPSIAIRATTQEAYKNTILFFISLLPFQLFFYCLFDFIIIRKIFDHFIIDVNRRCCLYVHFLIKVRILFHLRSECFLIKIFLERLRFYLCGAFCKITKERLGLPIPVPYPAVFRTAFHGNPRKSQGLPSILLQMQEPLTLNLFHGT